MLALVGPRFPDRLRAFMLTIIVVDDVIALLVIAIAYSESVALEALLIAAAVFGLMLARPRRRHPPRLRLLPARRRGLGRALRVGRRPGRARPRGRPDRLGLPGGPRRAGAGEQTCFAAFASSRRRSSPARPAPACRRRSPRTPACCSSTTRGRATSSCRCSPSPTSASRSTGDFLSEAYSSPITLGILFGYVLGKPVGVTGVSWLVTRLSGGRLRPPVGWAATAGGGAIAGIGFTVSLLIATLAFDGAELREAKLGRAQRRALCLGADLAGLPGHRAAAPPDADPRDAGRLGDARRPGRAGRSRPRPLARAARGPGDGGRVRRLRVPLLRQGRAGRARAAGGLRRRPLRLAPPAALRRPPERRARRRGLGGGRRAGRVLGDARPAARPPGRPEAARPATPTPSGSASTSSASSDDLRRHLHAPRVEEDVDSADISGVTGTPTFFVNERRHDGAYDIDSLSAAVRAARRALGNRILTGDGRRVGEGAILF